MKSNRPVVVLTFDWILQWLPLRMTLNARVRRTEIVQLCRGNDVQGSGIRWVLPPGTVATFTSDVPFLYCLRGHIVIHGVTAITKRPRRTLHIIRRIKWYP